MDANLIWVLSGCVLIGAGASIVGCFSYLRKKALIGDAIAHALLPGVALAFLIFEVKSTWVLFPGAIIAGWLSLLSIEGITRYSKIKTDSAIAIVLSVFFAGGVVLLSRIQNGAYGNQSGLNSYLFGKAGAMVPSDIQLFIAVDIVLIATVFLTYPFLKLYSFDPSYSKAVGLPVKRLNFLLATLTVLAVATGIQAVGIVLMAALIVTPAAAARFYSGSLSKMMLIACAFGVISAVAGVLISYSAPSLPTGPWIVVVLSVMAIGTFIFAPKKGVLKRALTRRQHRLKMMDENVIKALYHLGDGEKLQPVSLPEVSARRKFQTQALEDAISRLKRKDLVRVNEDGICLSVAGLNEAMRVVRLHRLWELYLNRRMNIARDHVHPDAEAIEHIITPELEQALIEDLGFPVLDPHQSLIPGIKSR